jgi:hypothetical protein
MTRLRKLLRLQSGEWWLLIKASLLLAAIRLGLILLPFQTLRRFLARMTEAPVEQQKADQFSVDKLAWAVTKVSRYVPKATCLTQALAAQVLMARRGHPAHLRVGFANGEEGRLQGHAWLESQGQIVVGGGDLSRFARLQAMEKESR